MSLAILVFPVALLIVAFSSCDLRYRSEKRGCRNGSAAQCLAVGRFYESRTDGLVATMLSNAVTAKTYYDLACKQGDRVGCARFGHMVVVGSYNSIRDGGFTHDDGMSALGRACDGGDAVACGELSEAGDPAHAAAGLVKLCDGGNKASCDKLVDAYRETDPPRAAELLAKLCQAGDNDHCRELGRALLAGTELVHADPARANDLLTKACDRGSWDACTELGEAYLDGKLPSDPARVDVLLAKACDHGQTDACFDRGKLLLGSDPAKAVQVFTAECEGGDTRGCDALGDLYRVGTPEVARDRDRARSFYDRACRGGDDFDCYKRQCMQSSSSDDCYKMRKQQRDRRFRLGDAFDMR